MHPAIDFKYGNLNYATRSPACSYVEVARSDPATSLDCAPSTDELKWFAVLDEFVIFDCERSLHRIRLRTLKTGH